MLSIRRDAYGGGRSHLVDRDFFPRRDSQPEFLLFEAIETTPDPLQLLEAGKLEVGRPSALRIRRTSAAIGDIAASTDESEAAIELTASVAIALPDGKVIEHVYTLWDKRAGAVRTRVYFPELFLDVDRQRTPQLAGVAFGAATSSMDFSTLFEEKANQHSPTIDCLSAFRASPGYQAASLEYAGTADA